MGAGGGLWTQGCGIGVVLLRGIARLLAGAQSSVWLAGSKSWLCALLPCRQSPTVCTFPSLASVDVLMTAPGFVFQRRSPLADGTGFLVWPGQLLSPGFNLWGIFGLRHFLILREAQYKHPHYGRSGGANQYHQLHLPRALGRNGLQQLRGLSSCPRAGRHLRLSSPWQAFHDGADHSCACGKDP